MQFPEVNIRGMDEASASVSHSTDLAGEADRALGEIVRIAEITADKVRSIATASEKQSAASEAISHGTGQISEIAGNTADLMSMAKGTVNALTALTRRINILVDELKKA
jgi:methyl-accepting chemotaxis protein